MGPGLRFSYINMENQDPSPAALLIRALPAAEAARQSDMAAATMATVRAGCWNVAGRRSQEPLTSAHTSTKPVKPQVQHTEMMVTAACPQNDLYMTGFCPDLFFPSPQSHFTLPQNHR